MKGLSRSTSGQSTTGACKPTCVGGNRQTLTAASESGGNESSNLDLEIRRGIVRIARPDPVAIADTTRLRKKDRIVMPSIEKVLGRGGRGLKVVRVESQSTPAEY